MYEGEELEESEGQLLYEKQREYYLKMLGEEKVKNLEDLTNLEVQREEQIVKDENQKNIEDNNNINNTNNMNNINYNENNVQEIKNQVEHKCYPLNYQMEQNNIPINPLKKKENPALLPPNFELLKNKENNNFVCCVHHSQLPINYQEKDPKNYQGMPPCMLSSIIPAGKPSHVLAPLNIFANEYTE